MKYALIGCSRISANHLAAAQNNGLTLVAVADLYRDKMSEVLNRHGLNDSDIKQYTDHKEMLSKERPELVSIATGSGAHASIALDCIDCGVNVIIEKPMTMSISDADAIIERSKKNNVKVAVCHQNRFNPSVKKIRRALDEGHFGRLSHGSVHVRWNRNQDYYAQASWRGTWTQDGGCLLNQCIHSIDILRWFMGRVATVYGVTQRRLHSYLETEDVGLAVITFENGAVATIEGTTNVYPRNLEETLYLFGEKGTVKLGGKSMNNIDVWNFADDIQADIAVDGKSGHSALFADMIDAINSDRDPYVNAQAGRDAIELVLAIYKSSVEGRPVTLPLKDCDTKEFIGMFDRKREVD